MADHDTIYRSIGDVRSICIARKMRDTGVPESLVRIGSERVEFLDEHVVLISNPQIGGVAGQLFDISAGEHEARAIGGQFRSKGFCDPGAGANDDDVLIHGQWK